jgi:hypothetical protein
LHKKYKKSKFPFIKGTPLLQNQLVLIISQQKMSMSLSKTTREKIVIHLLPAKDASNLEYYWQNQRRAKISPAHVPSLRKTVTGPD